MYVRVDRADCREIYFSGGLCLHFRGGGWDQDLKRHLLGCKAADTSLFLPREIFFTFQNEDTSLSLYFSKEALRRRRKTTVSFFLSKCTDLYLTYRRWNYLKNSISFSSPCSWDKTWDPEEPEWYYLLTVCK